MPLLTPVYKQRLLKDIEKGVKSGLNDKLAPALQKKIDSANFQEKLRVKLDGSVEWNGKETDAEDIDKAYQNIRERSKPLFAQHAAALVAGETPDEELIEMKIREISANEMANAISSSVITWLNDIVVPAFSTVAADVYSDVISDTLSKVVSNRTEEYIKSASIGFVLPIGSVTLGAGPAAIMNPVPIEIKLDPLLTYPDAIMKTAIPIVGPGRLS